MMVKTLAWALSDILLQIASKEGGTGNVKIACVHGEGHVDGFDQLHAQMRFKTVTERVQLEHSLLSIMNQLQGSYGVVLFMYSCVATRGPDAVREDMGMDVEPLISMPFGHASLSLVNLLLAGISTPHVHNGVQDVGVPLKGIDVQTQIGYLTVLESLRYITVGTLLKGPKFPVWVIGSETHMTVIFSADDRLVKEEDGQTTITTVERSVLSLSLSLSLCLARSLSVCVCVSLSLSLSLSVCVSLLLFLCACVPLSLSLSLFVSLSPSPFSARAASGSFLVFLRSVYRFLGTL